MDDNVKLEDTPYMKGYNAFVYGDPDVKTWYEQEFPKNPHVLGDENWREWRRGYQQACFEWSSSGGMKEWPERV